MSDYTQTDPLSQAASNESLAGNLLLLSAQCERSGQWTMARELREVARRLAALPRIYDVSKAERPEEDLPVVVVDDESACSDPFHAKLHEVRILFIFGMDEVDYIIRLSDLAAWVKGVKG